MSSLHIENHSNDTVAVAVAYNPCNGNVIAEGWWQVQPNQSQTFRAQDGADLYIRMQARNGDEITFSNFNNCLWWSIPQARFTLSREAEGSAVQVLCWGSNLEKTHKKSVDQPFPDGWSNQRFFRVGPGNHTSRIESSVSPARIETDSHQRLAAEIQAQQDAWAKIPQAARDRLVNQILAQGNALFQQILSQHHVQVERFHLNKLEEEYKRGNDSIKQLRFPLTTRDLEGVMNYLQAQLQYLDSYQPLLQQLRQVGLTGLALRVSQMQADLRTALAQYQQWYQDALKHQNTLRTIQAEASSEATKLLMETTTRQAETFRRAWEKAQRMTHGSPEWAAELNTNFGR